MRVLPMDEEKKDIPVGRFISSNPRLCLNKQYIDPLVFRDRVCRPFVCVYRRAAMVPFHIPRGCPGHIGEWHIREGRLEALALDQGPCGHSHGNGLFPGQGPDGAGNRVEHRIRSIATRVLTNLVPTSTESP